MAAKNKAVESEETVAQDNHATVVAQAERKSVVFLGPHHRYSRGDIACFEGTRAEELVNRRIAILILTLDDVKTQLRLELDFTEHDAMLTQMVNAAQRSIERDYYCKLVTSDEELQALPETVRGFIADEDIRLAIQFLVSDAYLNGHTGQWLETDAVRHLLFPLQEHTL